MVEVSRSRVIILEIKHNKKVVLSGNIIIILAIVGNTKETLFCTVLKEKQKACKFFPIIIY